MPLEQNCSNSRRRDEHASGPRLETHHENINSTRFSKNFLENEMSSRSNVTISSTVSSPGYSIRDEIDPSTYSFTTALKALQARSVHSWEYISISDGLSLNSKWNDAEKYICNPLSGQVPLECLSAKTLSSRSLSCRITMSAPLIYPSHLKLIHPKPPIIQHHHNHLKFTVQEIKKSGTRDVGIQSTLDDFSSESSYSPSTEERSTKESGEEETGDSSVSSGKLKPEADQIIKVREREEEGRERKKVMMMWRCDGQGGGRRGGCGISLIKGLWHRSHKYKYKYKSRDNNNPTTSPTFHYHINACFNE